MNPILEFYLEVIKKLTNEFQDIEKTIYDTENARAKVISYENKHLNVFFFRLPIVLKLCFRFCRRKVSITRRENEFH